MGIPIPSPQNETLRVPSDLLSCEGWEGWSHEIRAKHGQPLLPAHQRSTPRRNIAFRRPIPNGNMLHPARSRRTFRTHL